MSVNRPKRVTHRALATGQSLYLYLVTLLLLLFSPALARPGIALALAAPLAHPGATNHEFVGAPVANKHQATSTTTWPPLTDTPAINGNTNSSAQLSLKFTIIAGRFWKFNIKSTSLSSHKQKELRLHRVVSSKNFIIDDDGWFQYNPQQQQLFAWPSLMTKQGTYHFVLLPSGVDLEADGENSINRVDIVANIFVELMRPLFQGAARADIDLLIDHKFSLDYLHRQSSYALLLNQIISVFDYLSPKSSATTQQHPTTSLINTIIATTNRQLQNNNLKLPQKLSDYLLINSSYSPDGELFSITWTTYSPLANGSIAQINDCRLNNINDIVTKLSSPSSGYSGGDEKFVIYYPLDAPYVSSQAIVPTGRGNYALKLTLNGPCQRADVIETLLKTTSASTTTTTASISTVSPPLLSQSSLVMNYGNVPVADVDDKKNNIAENTKQTPSSPRQIVNNSQLQVFTNLDAIEPNTAVQITSTTSSNLTTIDNTATERPTISTSNTHAAQTDSLASDKVEPDTSVGENFTAPNSSVSPNHLSEETTPGPIFANPSTEQSSSGEDALATSSEESPVEQQWRHKQQQQPSQAKTQPQAKSFANFLDANESKLSISTISDDAKPTNGSAMTTINPATDPVTGSPLQNGTTPSTSEPSINEDFIGNGILNDVVTYLVSMAVPISIVIGAILLISIFIAMCSLCKKRRKSKKFRMGDRFKFRYGSERRGFLKNSSKPVILEADQKSLSMGGTPLHQANKDRPNSKNGVVKNDYLKMKDMHNNSKEKSKHPDSPAFFGGPHVIVDGGGPSGDAVGSGTGYDEGAGCAGGDSGGGGE